MQKYFKKIGLLKHFRHIFFLLYFFLKLLPLFSQNDTMVFRPVNNQVLQQYDIRKIAIAKDGKLWLSSDKGVISFDGNEVRFFGRGEGGNIAMDNQSISRTSFDEADNLYCVVVWGKIFYLNTKTGKAEYIDIHVSSEDSSHFNKVYPYTEVLPDNEYLWGGRHNMGFIGYNLKSKTTVAYNLPSAKTDNKNGVTSIQKDRKRDDILWIGTNNGIYSFNKKTHEFKRNFACSNPLDSSGSDIDIFDMHVKNENDIWFTSSGTGVGCYNIKTGYYTIYPIKRQTSLIDPAKNILIFFQPRSDSEYYVGSSQTCPGIFNIRTHQYVFNTKTYESYPGLNINHFVTDSTGNLWCIIFGQLYYAAAREKKLNTIPLQNGERQNQLTNIFKTIIWDNKRKCYYAAFDNSDAIFVLDSNIRLVKSVPVVSLKGNTQEIKETSIYDIALDQKGRLWSCGSVLRIYDSISKKMLPVHKLFPKLFFNIHNFQNIVVRGNHLYLQPSNNSCKAIYRINTNNFSYDSIIIPYDKALNRTITFQTEKDMDVLIVDKSEHYAYLGMHNTVIQLNLNTKVVKQVSTIGIKEYQHFFNMFWYLLDDDNHLWVNSGDGITIFHEDNLKPLKHFSHPGGTYRLQFFNIDGRGIMCVLNSAGVLFYDYKNITQYKISLNDGLITFFNSSVACVNNTLFVGAELNALQYTPLDAVIKKDLKKKCYLSSIQLMGNPYFADTLPEYLHAITLPHDKNFISFTFSTTEYENPERLEYRYKLTGANEYWIQANASNRTVTYNNLEPGNYNLLLSIKQSDGKWNNSETSLHITILPAWWQTNWFKILFFTIVAILAFLLIRWRINSVRKEERQKAKQQEEKSKHEKELLELEAKALRAQMNPHFIFNCLNSIKALIQKKEETKAINYLTTFSKLIRTIFQNSDKREITLYDEIETCRLYTQLESMRFGNKFSYSFTTDETIDMKLLMVPALIIQPFIENAIWHGIMPKEDEEGYVHVSVLKEEENICCIIDDNGIGRELSKQNKFKGETSAHKSKGVHLTQNRLNLDNLLNERNASVEIIDKKDAAGKAAGTKVILKFKEY